MRICYSIFFDKFGANRNVVNKFFIRWRFVDDTLFVVTYHVKTEYIIAVEPSIFMFTSSVDIECGVSSKLDEYLPTVRIVKIPSDISLIVEGALSFNFCVINSLHLLYVIFESHNLIIKYIDKISCNWVWHFDYIFLLMNRNKFTSKMCNLSIKC